VRADCVAAARHNEGRVVIEREQNRSLTGTRQALAADDGRRVGVGDVFEGHFQHRRPGEWGSLPIVDVHHQRLGRSRAGESRKQCE